MATDSTGIAPTEWVDVRFLVDRHVVLSFLERVSVMDFALVADNLATSPENPCMSNQQAAKVSDQLRRIIKNCAFSRYEIGTRTGIDDGTLSRFMSGERGLSMKALDRLGDCLSLTVNMRRQPKPTRR